MACPQANNGENQSPEASVLDPDGVAPIDSNDELGLLRMVLIRSPLAALGALMALLDGIAAAALVPLES